MTDLTSRQAAVLRWLAAYIEEHGVPPSMREISSAFGYRSSTRATECHLTALEKKGYVRRDPGLRAIRVLLPAPRLAHWPPVRMIEGRLCTLVWGLAP